VIDKHAIIAPGAKIVADVYVGPFSIIGGEVEIDSGTWVGPHVVIQGKTKIGKNNKIFQFASIGADPQDKKYVGEETTLEIGDNNIFREFITVNRGTGQGIGTTKIGNHNLLLAYTHIAHDCVLGNGTVLANNTTLSGHVTINDNAVIGGFVKVVQFCTIGAYCYIGGDTGVSKDVLPYVYVSSLHGSTKNYGLNLVGLRRLNFSRETLVNLKRAYNIICRQNLTLRAAISKLSVMLAECPEVALFIDMLEKTKRGIVR